MTIFALIIFLAPTLGSDLKPQGHVVGIYEEADACLAERNVSIMALKKVSAVGDIEAKCLQIELDPGRYRRS